MKTKTFTDIDLSFEKHPVTNDIFIKQDESAIKNAIKNLVLTHHYERPFHSEIGSSVTKLMFENATPGIVAVLNQEIRNVIENFEPRAVVLGVNTNFMIDQNALFVSIFFKIINTEKPITVQFTLDRVR